MTGNGGNGIVGGVDGLPLVLLISDSPISDNSTDSSSNSFKSGSGDGSKGWESSIAGIIIFSRPVKIRREARQEVLFLRLFSVSYQPPPGESERLSSLGLKPPN